MTNAFRFWQTFRDGNTGLWCDTIYLMWANDIKTETCVNTYGGFYSSAGTGMGLMSEAVFAEMGLQTRAEAEARVLQTLATMETNWTKDSVTGFYNHFVQRRNTANTAWSSTGTLRGIAEYSTIDTAELMLGALFVGNYFGGQVQTKAAQLAAQVDWWRAFYGPDDPRIYLTTGNVGTEGTLTGSTSPFNEYFLVAYIARLHNSSNASTASIYMNKYYNTDSWASASRPDGFPKSITYQEFRLKPQPETCQTLTSQP